MERAVGKRMGKRKAGAERRRVREREGGRAASASAASRLKALGQEPSRLMRIAEARQEWKGRGSWPTQFALEQGQGKEQEQIAPRSMECAGAWRDCSVEGCRPPCAR